MDSKDLKSSCNSCGKSQIHDTIHKAGKALVNHLKSGGEQKVDITQDAIENIKAFLERRHHRLEILATRRQIGGE
jgi:hypothetical protein